MLWFFTLMKSGPTLKYGRMVFHRIVKCVYFGDKEWQLGKSDNHFLILVDLGWVTHDWLRKILKSKIVSNTSNISVLFKTQIHIWIEINSYYLQFPLNNAPVQVLNTVQSDIPYIFQGSFPFQACHPHCLLPALLQIHCQPHCWNPSIYLPPNKSWSP